MRKSTLFVLLSIISTGLYATSFPQHITTCLSVYNDGLGSPVQAGFVSSDVFDRGENTGSVQSDTQTCVSHTYNYGPKNIRLDVQATEVGDLNDTIFYPDTSCTYMFYKENYWMRSGYIATKARNETWNFTLKQVEPRNGYKYVYMLSCEHQSY